MRRDELPPRGTGAKGPAKPGQVYWIEDSGESFLAVVVRVGEKGNDLMTVYAYRWPGDPPDDLAAIQPSERALIYTLWKASRRWGEWTRLGAIAGFDPGDWPLEPMRHDNGDLVIPHPAHPGEILEQRPAPPEETVGLARYVMGTETTLLMTLRRMADPEVEFEPGTATPIRRST